MKGQVNITMAKRTTSTKKNNVKNVIVDESKELINNDIEKVVNTDMKIDNNKKELNYSPSPWSWDRDDEAEFLMDCNNNIVEFNKTNKKLMELAPEMYEVLDCIITKNLINNDKEVLNDIERIVNKIKHYHPYDYSYKHSSGINLFELLNEFEDMMNACMDYIEVGTITEKTTITNEINKFVDAYGFSSVIRGEWELEIDTINIANTSERTYKLIIRISDYVDKVINAESSYIMTFKDNQ